MSHDSCYHCGLPIPENVDFQVDIGGQAKEMCCLGCQAVAQAIVDNGLADYYRTRDALPESPREAVPAVLDQLALFDHAEFQKGFVTELEAGEREASLMLEGITCAACIWLNEKHIGRLPGVKAVDINYATRRARVRWQQAAINLSDILAAVAEIGYRAYPYDATKHEELARKERRDAMWRLWVAGFGMMQVMMYAIPVYLAGEGEMSIDVETLMRWASLSLTIPVVFYSSAPFFQHAWRDIKLGRVGMDVPVALGVGVAFVASIWSTLVGGAEVYFDSVTMFVFFLLGGRYLEMVARQRAVGVTEALAKLQPAFAEKVPGFPDSKEVSRTAVSELALGDCVLVRPGAVFPVDGVVLEGESHANESLLTGESMPIRKLPGDRVVGGAVNTDSPLYVRVEHLGDETRLSAIVRLMERAACEKPKLVELADRVAAKFVTVLLAVALLVACAWYVVDPSKALWITVSVLVVTCPCALSLATPIALTVAAGAMAKAGLLVTRGHGIETLARANHFVFDKTGTLTQGKMRVLKYEVSAGADATRNLALAAALEQGSEHPIARAVVEHASGAEALKLERIIATTGRGVEGWLEGRRYRIGRPDYVAEISPQALGGLVPSSSEQGLTEIVLGTDTGLLAGFSVGDEIRPDALPLVEALRQRGHKLTLLSGDSLDAASQVAQRLGIPHVVAGVSPDQKHQIVKRMQEEGDIVAMVGDGVNDAPVLAQAQVSIAMGGGAQLARTQADIVLLSEHLDHLRIGIQKAEQCLVVIKQNLWWSFAYNFVAIPLAVAGYVTPWLAGIGMSASSLLVVLNSLRIQAKER